MGRSRSRSRSRERHRRKRSRSRSRSRDRRWRRRSMGRSRSRGRDRSGDRSRFLVTDPAGAQQAQIAQQILAQQAQTGPIVLSNGKVIDAAAITADMKQRQVYVGNLPVGVITKPLLEEFFNQSLSHLVPDSVATPPVININMDPQGRFGFVEFRTREMANQVLLMDKLVEIHGRHIQCGRPKGYEEPTGPPLPLSIAAPHAPGVQPLTNTSTDGGSGSDEPTKVLLLSNILRIGELRAEEDRSILSEEVKAEAEKHGAVDHVVIPPPPYEAQDRGPGRAYILYKTVEDATKARAIFHTRTLDDNKIKASFVPESEFELSSQGQWIPRHASISGIPLPGLYTIAPLTSGVAGLSVLNPALSALAQATPGIAAALVASIDENEVPFEEGWLKLRGFPPVVTKQHIIEFFKGCAEPLTEEDIKLVYSADGTALGEAFVSLHGPHAKLRLALARDRSPLPPVKVPAEVLTSFKEDMERRMLSGCKLV